MAKTYETRREANKELKRLQRVSPNRAQSMNVWNLNKTRKKLKLRLLKRPYLVATYLEWLNHG